MDNIELEKKIKMIVGQLGHILKINPDGSINVNPIDSITSDTIDIPGTWKPISPTAWEELVSINADPSKTIFIKNIDMSMTGHSANFIIEKVDDDGTEFVREFHLNYQNPSFDKTFGNGIPLIDNGKNMRLRVKAKMNWQNQNGHAIASINGFK